MQKQLNIIKTVSKDKRYRILTAICFIAGTLWIGMVDTGVYTLETCVARYFIVFFVGYAGEWIIREKKINPIAIKYIICLAALLLLSIGATHILVKTGCFHIYSMRMVAFVFGAFTVVFLLVEYMRAHLSEALLLAMIVFVIGTVYSVSYPAGTGISWDDQTHYSNILQISHFNDTVFTRADGLIIQSSMDGFGGKNTIESLNAGTSGIYEKKINELYRAGKKYKQKPTAIKTGIVISYLPEAICLFLARCLNIPYTSVFTLGRWIGVLLYSAVLYLSLRCLKSGRITFFVLSMFPGTLFLMSNYSYDIWGICLSMLAFSMYLGILQDDDRRMQTKDILIICLTFALAFSAKPNYFCMILAILFIDKFKLDEKISQKKYHAFVVLTSVIVAASFVIPFLVSGTGGNDMRGGADVNSAEQIKYIINNPMAYTQTLLSFLKGYWSPWTSNYVNFFAFFQVGKYNVALILFAIAVAVLDRQPGDERITTAKRRLWTWLLAFVASCIFATIMYIAFTPVGSTVINGCQPRYILPLLPFVAYYIGDYRMVSGIREAVSQKTLVFVTCTVSFVYAYYCLYDIVLSLY